MNHIIIGVGSNISPKENVMRAREILSQEQTWLRESQFQQTKPVGLVNQPDFLNGAFYFGTTLSLNDLKQYLKSVERRLGRIKKPGVPESRTIDLDIIVFNNTIIDEDYVRYDFVKHAIDEIAQAESLVLHNGLTIF